MSAKHENVGHMPAEQAIHVIINGLQSALRAELFGQALRVLAEDAQRSLLPLRRLERLSVRGNVMLSAELLSACASRGILVSVEDSDGNLRAMLSPLWRRRTSLAEALEKFATLPDWPTHLEDWRRNLITMEARRMRLADPASIARSGWQSLDVLATRVGKGCSRAQRFRLISEMRSWALLFAARVLSEVGCPPHWLGAHADPVRNLAMPFAQFALWRLAAMSALQTLPELIKTQHHRKDANAAGIGPAWRRHVQAYEPELRQALMHAVQRFYSWLLEMAAPRECRALQRPRQIQAARKRPHGRRQTVKQGKRQK